MKGSRDAVTAELIRAAPTAGPSLARSLRPAVRLIATPADDREIPVGASKIGGAPDLPAGFEWPSWVDRTGTQRNHVFFAQIDLTEVSNTAPAPLDLPTHGLLSFFCDYSFNGLSGIVGLRPWEQPGSRIVHTQGGEPLARRASPLDPLPSAALSPVGIWTWPPGPSDDVELPDSEYDALDALDQTYETGLRTAGSRSGRHQLGGHARYIQHPVEEEVVQALHVNDDDGRFMRDRWERARHLVPEWRVVLQLDSDPGLDLMWGDVGTLYWAARQRDIDAGRWEAAMFNFQCS